MNKTLDWETPQSPSTLILWFCESKAQKEGLDGLLEARDVSLWTRAQQKTLEDMVSETQALGDAVRVGPSPALSCKIMILKNAQEWEKTLQATA